MNKNRLAFVVLIFLSVGLSGCGGGSSSGSTAVASTSAAVTSQSQSSSSSLILQKPVALEPDQLPDPSLPARDSVDWDKAVDASRFLARTTFGATPKDIDYIVKNGKEAWLDKQLSLPQTSQIQFLDKRLAAFGFMPVTPYMYFDAATQGEWDRLNAQHEIWMETSIWGADQLRQRVAFALSQIIVVSHHGADEYARERGFANYIDILGKQAFGNYGDLLVDVTLNPIMGIYLSAVNNPKADEAKHIRPDENYAREILQLFSIGLDQLNKDGSLELDNNGKSIPTYDLDVVKEFSRVFTGWSFSSYSNFAELGTFGTPIGNVEPLKAFPEYHDLGEKKLLNGEIDTAGKSPRDDLQAAIDNIMRHKNVAPFIGKKLIQYLVTSNPSPAYVERVARVFDDNGKGVKGDMKAVLKAIYLDDEALNPPSDSLSYFGKRKETPLMVSGIWRAFNAKGVGVKGPNNAWVETIQYMHGDVNEEQEMLWAPSVFNFYQSTYSPPGLLEKNHVVAPEFQVFNDTMAVSQANLLSSIIFDRDVSDKNLYTGTGQGFGATSGWNNPPVKAILNLSDELSLAATPVQLVDRINLLLAHGQLSAEDSQMIADHIALISDPLDRVYEAIFLIAISPEYAIQG